MNAIGWESMLPVIAGTLAIIASWPIVHYFNLRREIAAEKRKLRVTYLLEAYRRLEDAGNRPLQKGGRHSHDIETAIADIQLLGTPEQVKLAQAFAIEFAESRTGSFDPILQSLRRSLRSELELEPVDDILKFLRIVHDRRNTK